MKTEKILVMTTGERIPVTGEKGKYWLTKDSQYRKFSHQISSVEEVEICDAEPAKDVEICESEPKKKPTSRKKKKAEPAKEEPKEGE